MSIETYLMVTILAIAITAIVLFFVIKMATESALNKVFLSYMKASNNIQHDILDEVRAIKNDEKKVDK